MKPTNHRITHYYQPTNNSCGYAALATLLSHYGDKSEPDKLMTSVPQPVDENGEPIGSITAQLATWCQEQDYRVNFYSFDFQITDFGWRGLSNQELSKRLKAAKGSRQIPNIGGKYWSEIYIQAYIDLLESGGKLSVKPHVTSTLLYELLDNGPVYANIAPSVAYGSGRTRDLNPSERTEVPDDVHGTVGTHSVVIYGNDKSGNFLVSDPWNGLLEINPETMLCAITAAIVECDSQCFQIHK